jgi:phage shock protein E
MTQQAPARPRFRGSPVDVVIDVRSHIEFWLGHLPGAVCIPAGSIVAGVSKRADVASNSRILLYCASGARSAAAAQALQAAGYKRVVDGGGMSAASAHFTPADGG